MVSLLIFLAVLGILIFVHELGHFLVAKWTKMRVDEFALGFPPTLLKKKKGETTYMLNALPLGGYVRIHGEMPDAADTDPRSFNNKSVWARMAVLSAGVVMNVILAFVLLTGLYVAGFSSLGLPLDELPGADVKQREVVVMGYSGDNSPVKEAGIAAGERIVSLRGESAELSGEELTVQAVQQFTQERQEAGELRIAAVTKSETAMHERTVNLRAEGFPLGAALQEDQTVKLPIWQAPRAAVEVMGHVVNVTWDALKGFVSKLIFQAELDSNISGPVGIYKVTANVAEQGLAPLVFLTATLSANLALLNIMPIPALDGGKLVFLAIEAVARRRIVPEKFENGLTVFGFILLIGLIAVITVRDIGLF